MKRLVIINAGLSDPSTTLTVARQVADDTVRRVNASGDGGDVEDLVIETVNLRGLASDLATFMTTFMPTAALEEARATVMEADALIAATPVFQGSYSGLFKMFFDTLDMHALDGTPVTMVATAGTVRHSMVLDYAVRPLLSFLHAVVLPTGVFAATEEFGAESALQSRVGRAAGELAGQLTVSDGAGRAHAEDAPAAPDTASGTTSGRAGNDDFRVPDGGFASLLAGHTGS